MPARHWPQCPWIFSNFPPHFPTQFSPHFFSPKKWHCPVCPAVPIMGPSRWTCSSWCAVAAIVLVRKKIPNFNGGGGWNFYRGVNGPRPQKLAKIKLFILLHCNSPFSLLYPSPPVKKLSPSVKIIIIFWIFINKKLRKLDFFKLFLFSNFRRGSGVLLTGGGLTKFVSQKFQSNSPQ